jgi:putative transcriptional regulator
MSRGSAARLADFERLGGILLEEQPPADLSADLLERTLARLEDAPPARHGASIGARTGFDPAIGLPAPLAMRRIGKWRWFGPGAHYALVDVPEDPEFKVFLLRADAGVVFPEHGHFGTELTLILKGHLSDETGVYAPGDIAEKGMETDHHPRVEPDGECICLVALEGRLRPKSWVARMAMRIHGF